ncbi:MAG TPA: VCBS repeat-containing protein [Verrucomicrobiae bacterium]|jgi:hypothetical protein
MKTIYGKLSGVLAMLALFISFQSIPAHAQGTAFSYQGKLSANGTQANGSYDLAFTLYDSTNVPGNIIAGPVTNSATAVSNGLFSATIDFGPGVFTGSNYWLSVAVRTNHTGSFSVLAPRQPLMPVPYSIYSASAGISATANSANSVLAGNISGPLSLSQLPAGILTNGSTGVSMAGNFSGDGEGLTNVNLATANSYGALKIQTNWGNFAPSYGQNIGSYPQFIAIADVNGDNLTDLICVNYYDNTLSVLTNAGAGTFDVSAIIPVSFYPLCVAAADVNGDGKMDLISANEYGLSLSVLTNDGDGNFSISSTVGVGTEPGFVVAADVNGDHKMDLVTCAILGSGLMVYTNDGNGNFTEKSTAPTGSGPSWITAADVNGDHSIDMITADIHSGTVTVLTNDGEGDFSVDQTLNVGLDPDCVIAVDVNGDGYKDLIVANQGDGDNDSSIMVWTNDGTGHFSLSTTFGSGASYNGGPYCLATADVNLDGKPDLICANNTGTVNVFTNDGAGNFTASATLGAGAAVSVAAGDLSGDGIPDLASINSGLPYTSAQGSVTVFTNFLSVNSTFAGTVNGNQVNWGSGAYLWNDQGGSIELGNSLQGGATPYIDFHYGTGSGDDYNVRLINDASGQLSLFGNFNVNGTITGDGGGIIDLDATNLTGIVPLANLAGISGDQLDAATWLLATNLNGGNAALATNVVAGINITNAFITNSVFAGNGRSLTNLQYANILNTPIIPSTNGFVTASITNGFATTNYVLTRGYLTNANGGNAALATNVVSGINITNASITNSYFAGNGAGLTNLPANVAMLTSNQIFTGSNVFQVVDSYGGLRITDGSTNSNVSLQPLAGADSGFQAINFNGYYNGGEHVYNTNKARWRIFVDQRSSTDTFYIDEYYHGTGNVMLSITTNGVVSGNAVMSQGNLGSTNSFTATIGNGSANFTTTTSSGYYAKVGNLVYFENWVVWSSKGSATSGNIVVSLPPVPIVSSRAAFNVGYINGISVTNQLVAFASAGSTAITLGAYSSTGVNIVQASNCGATGELQITGTYRWQ